MGPAQTRRQDDAGDGVRESDSGQRPGRGPHGRGVRGDGPVLDGTDETRYGAAAAIEAAMDDDLGDELLGLIFTACHPMLSAEARAALTLKVVGGLTTDEIARAFLSSEAAIAQRIVRAKKAIAKAGLTFEVPRGAERAARLPSVLEVVYLIFNEGYSATAGDDLLRPDLCLEAQRLGRMLAG